MAGGRWALVGCWVLDGSAVGAWWVIRLEGQSESQGVGTAAGGNCGRVGRRMTKPLPAHTAHAALMHASAAMPHIPITPHSPTFRQGGSASRRRPDPRRPHPSTPSPSHPGSVNVLAAARHVEISHEQLEGGERDLGYGTLVAVRPAQRLQVGQDVHVLAQQVQAEHAAVLLVPASRVIQLALGGSLGRWVVGGRENVRGFYEQIPVTGGSWR